MFELHMCIVVDYTIPNITWNIQCINIYCMLILIIYILRVVRNEDDGYL